jgi:hypothetical protein
MFDSFDDEFTKNILIPNKKKLNLKKNKIYNIHQEDEDNNLNEKMSNSLISLNENLFSRIESTNENKDINNLLFEYKNKKFDCFNKENKV